MRQIRVEDFDGALEPYMDAVMAYKAMERRGRQAGLEIEKFNRQLAKKKRTLERGLSKLLGEKIEINELYTEVDDDGEFSGLRFK